MESEILKRRTVVVIALASLVVLVAAIAAPLSGWTFPQAALSTACHQDPSRCLLVAGLPMALCARCSAIFCGLLSGSVIVFLAPPFRSMALRLLISAVSLTVVDVLAESAGFYSNLFALRLATGWFLGLTVILMIGHRARISPLTALQRLPIPMQP